jgi:hypothetical protein
VLDPDLNALNFRFEREWPIWPTTVQIGNCPTRGNLPHYLAHPIHIGEENKMEEKGKRLIALEKELADTVQRRHFPH